MAVRLNENPEIVARIKEGLKQKGGYCPCRLQRTEEFKCICKEFREQSEGECYCGLYIKVKDNQIVITGTPQQYCPITVETVDGIYGATSRNAFDHLE